MSILLILAFLLLCVIIFNFIKISKVDIEQLRDLFSKEKTLKQLANKKQNKFVVAYKRIRAMLYATGQISKLYYIIAASIALFAVGIIAGIFVNNPFLSPVFAIGLATLPFLYIQFQYIRYKAMIVDELETSLSIITSSLERSGGNIIIAVKENIDYIENPVKTIFSEFVFAVETTNTNIEAAIEDMKSKIDHFVFKEWCDILKRCVHDRTLISSLQPNVTKLSSIKIETGELQNILHDAKGTYFALLFISIGLLALGFLVMPKGFGVDLPELASKIVLAANIALMVFLTIFAMIDIREVDFDV